MYDIVHIINLINDTTKYKADYLRDKQPTLTEAIDLPIIGVGFYDLNSKSPTTPAAMEFYQMTGENLVQGFDVQIICEQKDLVVIWREVFKALVGTNEEPIDEQFSGLTYASGGVIGFDNGRINWLDRYRIDFPTINVI